MSAMQLDLMIEDARWESLELRALATRATRAVLAYLDLDSHQTELSVLACDDARISDLNAAFRGKAEPTNVLSWPTVDLSPDAPGAMPQRPIADPDGSYTLGDVAIAWETCAREAETGGKDMSAHVTHLMVHGVLHLLGFDHITEPDAARMESIEVEILGNLGVNDPYRETNET